jgi:hypothetical protein
MGMAWDVWINGTAGERHGHSMGTAWYVSTGLTTAHVGVICSPLLLTKQKVTGVRFNSTNKPPHITELCELHSQFLAHMTRAISSTNKCHPTASWQRGMPDDQMISPLLCELYRMCSQFKYVTCTNPSWGGWHIAITSYLDTPHQLQLEKENEIKFRNFKCPYFAVVFLSMLLPETDYSLWQFWFLKAF